MLYGRRLDQALEHVDGSRYALVHAVAKRARQITLWLTADPAELRAEAAPPPAPGELVSRDPVALSEAEILAGEVTVRWDPDGKADERELPEPDVLETDPLLMEGLVGEEDEDFEGGDEEDVSLTPALAQALEGEAAAAADDEGDDEDEEEPEVLEDEDEPVELTLGDDADDLEAVPLDTIVEEEEAGAEEDEEI